MRVILVLVAVLCLGVPFAAAADPPPPTCEMSIRLFPFAVFASITETTSANASFNASFFVNKTSNLTGTVFFELFVNTGWPGTIEPAAFTMAEGERLELGLKVNVTVPAAQQLGQDAQVTVRARSDLGETLCEQAFSQAIAGPLLYHGGWTGALAPESVQISRGAAIAVVNVTVHQATNFARDRFAGCITFAPQSALSLRAPNPPTFAQLDNVTIGATFDIAVGAGEATFGEYVVTVEVRSRAFVNGTEQWPVVVALTLRVRVDDPLALAQLWASALVGGAALAGTAVWIWRSRRDGPRGL